MIQTAFLGDVVLTTPLLEAVARKHGPVDVVTTPAALPLVETHPAVRRVIPYDKHGKDRGPGKLFALARRLRAERYEVAYLPHRSLRTAALALLGGIPRRVGFRGPWSYLYTEARPRPSAQHESERLLSLAGDGAEPARPRLYPTDADRAAARALLRSAAITGDWVALAPGSIWGSKRWPHYGELARRLAERVAVVAVGGPEDVTLGEEIVEAAGERGAGEARPPGWAVNACGRLTLRQSAALIEGARVLVTNDSAPLHLASAMGTSVVAIFGPTIPEFGFGPRGPRDRALGVAGLSCRPCSRHGPPSCPLGHHLCMKSLTVDEVLQAIEETGALHRRD